MKTLTIPWSDNLDIDSPPAPEPANVIMGQAVTLNFVNVDSPRATATGRILEFWASQGGPAGAALMHLLNARFSNRTEGDFDVPLTVTETALTLGLIYVEVRDTTATNEHVLARRLVNLIASPPYSAFVPPPPLALDIPHGGTGADLSAAGAGLLYKPLVGSTAFVTLGIGAGLAIVGPNLTATGGGGSGTVTSVGLSMPGIFAVGGSPVTVAGTLAVTLGNQVANVVWAGPASGAAAPPAFRALVLADIGQSAATSGQVPTWSGAAWVPQTPSGGGGGLASGGAVTGATAGRVLFVGTGPVLADSPDFTFTDGGASVPTAMKLTHPTSAGFMRFGINSSNYAFFEQQHGIGLLCCLDDFGVLPSFVNGTKTDNLVNLGSPTTRWLGGYFVSLSSGIIELQQVSSGGTPGTNSARLYAKDVAGTAELFVKDEAGNETQLSPHAMDGPAALYDGTDDSPYVVKETNYYLGKVRYLNLSRFAVLFQRLINGTNTLAQLQALPAAARQFIFQEDFAAHNARTSAGLAKASWATEQAKLQVAYDAARAADQAAHDAWIAREQARQAAHDAWLLAAAETRGSEPQRPGVEPEPPVRPARDIRKAVPPWLASRVVT